MKNKKECVKVKRDQVKKIFNKKKNKNVKSNAENWSLNV